MLHASDLFLYAYKSSVLGEMLKRVFGLILWLMMKKSLEVNCYICCNNKCAVRWL